MGRTFNPNRKPNANSKLKSLGYELQEEIWEKLHPKDGSQKALSIAELRVWLKEKHNITTSAGPISNWRGWYEIVRPRRRADFAVNAMIADAKQRDPNVSAEELFRLGQENFSRFAVMAQDVDMWRKVQQTEVEAEKIRLLKETAAKENEAKVAIRSVKMTDAEKAARIREIFGLPPKA